MRARARTHTRTHAQRERESRGTEEKFGNGTEKSCCFLKRKVCKEDLKELTQVE